MAEQLDAGDWRVPDLIVTPYGVSTAATLQLEAPDGTLTNPTPTKQDDIPAVGQQTWTAPGYEVSEGEWIERWAVTGTGASKARKVIQVAPDPADLLAERVYATTADYAKLIGAAPPTGARRALVEASRLVDEMLLTAVYDVDEDDLPTEAEHIAALRDAACMQAEWARASGDRYSVGAGKPAGFTLGRLSVQQQSATGAASQRGVGPRGEWAPRAWARLQRAGLTGHGPQEPGYC